jgi:hypothetical protein
MSYDSDASFADSPAAFTGDTSSDAAPAPDTAASAALLAETAVAMAAASSQDDFRADGGWDAPPPPMHTLMSSRAVAPGIDWDAADDDDAGVPNRNRRRLRPTTVSAKGQVLRDIALRAYTLHPDACHQSTAEVAHHFGHAELDGQSANQQVATLRKRWREVNGGQAGKLAERGVLAIAGLAGEANAGHTAVVVAGPTAVIDNKVYPAVCGGGLPMRRSDGTRTAADTWTPRERPQVRYFTPDTRKWLRRLLAFLGI